MKSLSKQKKNGLIVAAVGVFLFICCVGKVEFQALVLTLIVVAVGIVMFFIPEISKNKNEESIFYFKVKGVTFDNEDGSDRQEILKRNKPVVGKTEVNVELRKYLYQGEDAIGVYINNEMVGNVPKENVNKVNQIMDSPSAKIKSANIDSFEDDYCNEIYCMNVTLSY
ncbi:hypothetical protein [Dialister invisus]|uniref:hypothetical protein n=1 Tax=Dialister invisus TaxID=218538 RepID=UPI0023F6840D|nr:hypothetical protein [Dialister invisus]